MKTKAKSSVISRPSPTPAYPATDAQIADRAYALWLREGCPENRALDHWLAAKRELRGDAGLHDDAARIMADPSDPAASSASELDRELDRMVEPSTRQSATSL